ncbi:helix-turn-helix domain-containing protein [Gloeothece verrucosa]|uniref:Transcriptional regulator, XRE family n=1 Tax=Gloeothece verrucosa (strain PCC 7822) TaxID=497965 RepID=E0ULX6_GLOV7|nr:helix-turn-helix transcriptional regulator [Gloeothece verrucosa]ADN17956.1 transcriptional regulator, XRE family [Gloeothece verrucosa PCC 7822]
MTVICTLRQFIQERNLTQLKVAQDTGLSPTIIGNLSNNRFSRIDVQTAERLCKYLSCEFGDLFKIQN